MIPRDASLSENCTPNRCSFYSLAKAYWSIDTIFVDDDEGCPNSLARQKEGEDQGDEEEEVGDQIGGQTRNPRPGVDAPIDKSWSGVLDASNMNGGVGFHSIGWVV